mmetsp:Transcript_3723/g.9375  ORF Transcript_3723/g.9375 Transcript_3723/m.9375 type:complete len:650 (-) Transcript_3723:107-2056(-)
MGCTCGTPLGALALILLLFATTSESFLSPPCVPSPFHPCRAPCGPRRRPAEGCSRPMRSVALGLVASGSSGVGDELPPRLGELATWIGESKDEKEASLRLVQLGDKMAARLGPEIPPSLAPEARRVPGCIAVVSVAVQLLPAPGKGQQTVSVRGSADARVSRGLLALLVEGLEGLDADAVLRMDAGQITDRAKIRLLLPPGRNNGLANMLAVVKARVEELLKASTPASISQLAGGEASAGRGAGAKADNGLQTGANSGPGGMDSLEGSGPGVWGVGSSEEVAVLLSGGVDSSVSLKLCQQMGLKPRAFYLKIWLEDELAHLGECPWEEDWGYAKGVADKLGVPLEAVSLQQEYWDQVVSYLVDEAREGRTPNPDIMCNSRIKFGMFYDYVGKHFSRVATGHYARVEHDQKTGIARLLRSPDAVKDQTYFLSNLKQSQLASAMFPIGDLEKHRVRELAHEFDLPTQARKDSQGICFLGRLKFDDFVGHHLGQNPGRVLDYHSGEELGEHKGLWFHTIGQRKGLGEATRRHTHLGPWFVAAKDCDANVLYVSNKYETIYAPRSRFQVEAMNWISGPPPEGETLELDVKVRHGPTLRRATVQFEEEGRGRVMLDERDSGLAPGQFAAFYRGEECLGAASISDTTFSPSTTAE